MKALLTFGFLCGWVVLASAEDKKPDAKKFDAQMLLGKWKVTEGKKAGTAMNDEAKKSVVTITKDRVSFTGEDGKEAYAMEFTLDDKATPVTIDLKMVVPAMEGKAKGIIELDGDTLKICYDPMSDKRPEKYDGDKFYAFTLKREKKEDKK